MNEIVKKTIANSVREQREKSKKIKQSGIEIRSRYKVSRFSKAVCFCIFYLLVGCFILSAGTNAAVSRDACSSSDNLIVYSGFEANSGNLDFFKKYEAGYSVDEKEKHCGSRSVRLETDKNNKAQGFSYLVSGSDIKVPGQIIISGWSKAQNVSGKRNGDYALCVDINFADGSTLYGKTASFETGTHDWEYSAVTIKIDKAVKGIMIHALLKGNHLGTVWFDDLFVGNYSDGMVPYSGDLFQYTILPPVADLAVRLDKLKKRMEVLSGKIAQVEEANKDASMQRISLVVAELFSTYILPDAERNIKIYQRLKFSDFVIIGKEEVKKRIHDLPEFEISECERIVENAIAELTPIDNLRNKGYYRKDVFYKENAQIDIQNGSFTLNGKPTFFNGILSAPHQTMKLLGGNLTYTYITSLLNKDWEFSDKKNIKQPDSAKSNGLFVSPMIHSPDIPKWLTDATPGLLVWNSWWRGYFDIDNPIVKLYYTSLGAHAAAQVKNLPNVFCYNIMGEQHCNPSFKGPATQQRYANWLNWHFSGELEQLNRTWNKSYKDFEAAAQDSDSDSKSKGMLYCWNLFNQWRLTQLNKWIIDGIRQNDTISQARYYTCWPASGCLIGQSVGGWHSRMGVNLEDVIDQSSVPGWDGGFFPHEATESERYWPEEREKYNLAWRDEMTYYDFAKSVAPNRPIFDPEWHMIASVRHQSPLGISSDYIRLGLWMEHFHGMGAHVMWWWGRPRGITPYKIEFLGGLLTQPQLLEGWARTMLELQRLAEYITLFPVQERKVRILYSEASAIIDGGGYSNVLREAYEALYFQDYPVGFITEKMIAAGGLKNCALLIVPNTRYTCDSTVCEVMQFIKNGGRVAVIGKDSFKFDEYGRVRKIDFMEDATIIAGNSASEWKDRFDGLIAEAGVERPIRVLDSDGKTIEGLEMRTVRKDDKRIVYLLNLKHSPVALELRRKNGSIPKVRDLINDRDLDLNKTINIPSRGIMFLEVKNYE